MASPAFQLRKLWITFEQGGDTRQITAELARLEQACVEPDPSCILLRAAVEIADSKFSEALDTLTRINSSSGVVLSPTLMAQYIFRRGQAFAGSGQLSKAERLLRLIIKKYRREHQLVAKASADLATIFRKQGKFLRAYGLLSQLLESGESTTATNTPGLIYNLANVCIDLARYREAHEHLDEARRRFRKSGIQIGAALCDHAEGSMRLMLGLYKEAGRRFEKAANDFLAAHNPRMAGQAFENHGICLYLLNERIFARKQIFRAVSLYRSSRAELDLARVMGNLAWMTSGATAVRYASCAYERAMTLGSSREAASAAIAAAFASRSDRKTFKIWATRALKSARQTDSPLRHAEAAILSAHMNPRRATPFIKSALESLRSMDDDPIHAVLPWTGGIQEDIWTDLLELCHSTSSLSLVADVLQRTRRITLMASYLATQGSVRGIERSATLAAGFRATSFSKTTLSPAFPVLELHADSKGNITTLLTKPDGSTFARHTSVPKYPAWLNEWDIEIAVCESDSYSAFDRNRLKSAGRIIRNLSRHTLVPFEKDLRNETRLAILPSGIAHRIPFRALVHDLIERLSGNQMEVLLGYSRPSHFLRWNSPKRAIVVIGDTRGLDSARCEAAIVARETSAEILDSSRITKDEILRAYAAADYFHFIGHAASNASNPFLSHLVLAKGVRLSALELAACKNRQQCRVVLCACSAGNAGGGVGLIPAFFVSGAREVIASRWRIHDDASVAHVPLFLSGGLPIARDLHPWHWAGWERWFSW